MVDPLASSDDESEVDYTNVQHTTCCIYDTCYLADNVASLELICNNVVVMNRLL